MQMIWQELSTRQHKKMKFSRGKQERGRRRRRRRRIKRRRSKRKSKKKCPRKNQKKPLTQSLWFIVRVSQN